MADFFFFNLFAVSDLHDIHAASEVARTAAAPTTKAQVTVDTGPEQEVKIGGEPPAQGPIIDSHGSDRISQGLEIEQDGAGGMPTSI